MVIPPVMDGYSKNPYDFMGELGECPSANLEENGGYTLQDLQGTFANAYATPTRDGSTAKGAFALIAFFQKSLRACLRASFWQALVVRLLLEPLVHFLSEADKAEVDDEKNKEFDIASEQQKGTKPLVSVSW